MDQPILTHHLPRDAAAVRRVREWLVDELTARRALPAARIEDAAVMVSELASNVLAHTTDVGRVEVTITDDAVRVEVHDANGRGRPVVRPVDPSRLGGNGLRIVDAWSTEWGVSTGPRGGKSVWVCLAR